MTWVRVDADIDNWPEWDECSTQGAMDVFVAVERIIVQHGDQYLGQIPLCKLPSAFVKRRARARVDCTPIIADLTSCGLLSVEAGIVSVRADKWADAFGNTLKARARKERHDAGAADVVARRISNVPETFQERSENVTSRPSNALRYETVRDETKRVESTPPAPAATDKEGFALTSEPAPVPEKKKRPRKEKVAPVVDLDSRRAAIRPVFDAWNEGPARRGYPQAHLDGIGLGSIEAVEQRIAAVGLPAVLATWRRITRDWGTYRPPLTWFCADKGWDEVVLGGWEKHGTSGSTGSARTPIMVRGSDISGLTPENQAAVRRQTSQTQAETARDVADLLAMQMEQGND